MALPQDFKQEAPVSKYTMDTLKTSPKVKFRVLSEFIHGKSVWGDKDGKRIVTRRRLGESMPVSAIGINKYTGEPELVKQFIAAVAYNYTNQQVEIFETDKSKIIGQIVAIEADEDWGDSRNFDLSISKTGEGKETKYTVLPANKGAFQGDVKWNDIKLEALYTGENPFPVNQEDSLVAEPASGEVEDVSDDIPF